MELNRFSSVLIYLLLNTFLFKLIMAGASDVKLSDFTDKREQIRFVANVLAAVRNPKTIENVLFSPPSILTVLIAGHCASANSKTRREIFNILELWNNCGMTSETAKQFKSMANAQIANTLLVSDQVRTNVQNFKRYGDKFLNEKCLYSEDSAAVAVLINNKISRETNSKFTNIYKAQDVDVNTAAFMISTISFNAEWEKPFARTARDIIRNEENEISHICMLLQTNKFAYGNIPQLNASVIEIPFKYDDYSMLVFLPNRKDGSLKYLEEQLYNWDITHITQKLTQTRISLYLPEFSIKYEKSMRAPLQKMKVKRAFTHKATFGDFLENDIKTYIRDITHHASIEVDYNGFKGTAVTGAKWDFVKNETETDQSVELEEDVEVSFRSKNQPFEIDRPFVYAVIRKNMQLNIFHDRTNYLFVGTVRKIGNDKPVSCGL